MRWAAPAPRETTDRPAGGETGYDDECPSAPAQRRAEALLRGGEAAGPGDGPVEAFATAPGEAVGDEVAEHGRGGRAEGEDDEGGHVAGGFPGAAVTVVLVLAAAAVAAVITSTPLGRTGRKTSRTTERATTA